jgi:hypothetical protein
MYGHGFATQFLSQVYGMTRDPEQEALLRGVLTRAVALTSKAQADNGGWYYTPNTGADEGSVTITQVQGLRACRNVGIEVSYSVIKNAINYVKKSQNEDGSVNYSIGTSSSGGSPALTAAGLEVFNAAGAYGSKEAQKALEYISKSLKRTVGAYGHEVYFVYYASQGIFLAGDEVFREYWPTLRDQMLSSQHPDGSFPGDHVGEIYGTAMYAISLQLPFEYLPLYQR